jgi:hypothetical protein
MNTLENNILGAKISHATPNTLGVTISRSVIPIALMLTIAVAAGIDADNKCAESDDDCGKLHVV